MALTIVPVNTKRNGSSWAPGHSGNPKGAPRRAPGVRTVQELAREYTEDAIKQLVIAMHSPRDRVAAATAILDRGWGRPKQTIETEGTDSIHLHLLAALAVEPQQLERQVEPQQQRQPLVIDGTPTE